MTAAAAPRRLRYALITPARNEEAFIERALESVVGQTALPIRWIVVSDGSTDATDRIVGRYVERHPWIELVHLEDRDGRDFARKVRAFNAGYGRLCHVSYDLLGNLDADVSFDEELFAFLLDRFGEMPDLGVASARLLDGDTYYDYRFTNIDDVSGSCQLFRRECFEDVGGYVPFAAGGIDSIAVTTARMKGWTTKTFVEKAYRHHRKLGSAERGLCEAWFRRGEKDYALGGHPLWQAARSIYQCTYRPYLVGGAMLMTGYASSGLRRTTRPVPPEFVRFRRSEQMARLKRTAVRLLARRARPEPEGGGELAMTESLLRLEWWVEGNDYKGYEPFDGLSSPARRLTFGNVLLERLLQQVGRQSPINLRPLLGIGPLESTKGRAYMAAGYLDVLRRTGHERYRDRAKACLEWLMRNPSPLYPDYSWGNHFDYASRAGTYAKHESTIVWTSLIGHAFLDAYEHLGDESYLRVAEGVCRWITALPRETTDTGICLSYLATRQLSIHNANLLGAAMLARTAKHSGSAELAAVAKTAMEYSCARQLPSGAWYYGEEPRYHWIDSFHTGYGLDSIKCYIDHTGDRTFAPHLERGYRHFKATFFEADGRPRYYAHRAQPIDIQCAAQGIETLAKFADDDPDALPTAVKVARWTIRHMQDPSGYFYYRRYPFATAKIPMLHWGQATMYRALALLLRCEQRPNGSPA